MAFLDLAKAFDTISHDLFAKGLERLGVPSQFIRVVKDLYDGATTSFATVNGEMRHIRISRATPSPQSCSMCVWIPCSAALRETARDGGAKKTA